MCQELRLQGHLVENLPELARTICEESQNPHFFRRGSNSSLKQLLLMLGQVILEEKHAHRDGLLVCDRTIADHWSYTTTLFGEEMEASGIRDIAESYVRKHLTTYDLIFYLPPEFGPADDGIREDDLEFQDEIASSIRISLEAASVNFTEIRGDLDARTAIVIERIRHHLHTDE